MIVAGFGFRKAASADSLKDALSQARGDLMLHAFATLNSKADQLNLIADAFGLPVIAIDEETAHHQATQTHSGVSQSHTGIASVAEATALAAVGSNARLLAPRCISTDRMATCAIAIGDD